MPKQDDDIRPGVWVLTLASLLFTVGVVYVAVWGWPKGAEDGIFAVGQRAPGTAQRARTTRWRAVNGSSQGQPVGTSMMVPAAPTTFRVPFAAPTETASVEGDPQLERSRASYGGNDAGMPPFATWERVGRVASVTGTSPVAVGETCSVRVLPVETQVFNCMVRVMCGDTLLYPDPNQGAGYVACSIGERGTPSYASDDATTDNDTDPMVEINLALAHVLVGDRANDGREYHATITLEDPPPRFM